MRLVSLSEIPALEDGEPIPSVAGKIRQVYQRYSGTNARGDWALQDFVLSDGENEVVCKVGNMDDFSDMQGRDVVIECTKSDKHGLIGVKKFVDNYEGKIQHKIKLTGSCRIMNDTGRLLNNLSGGGVESRHAHEYIEEKPRRSDTTNGISGSSVPPTAQNGVTEARQHLMRASNLYCLCVKAVDTVIAPKLPAVAQTSDMFQAAVGTLFIEASRAGYVQKMPQKPITNDNGN
jgi:hypothetical protein